MTTIQIPKVGPVQFPDEMSDNEIAQASGELHSKALVDAVSEFMEADPSIQMLKTSEKHKALASIAAMLEKYPLLADAVDKGMATSSQEPQESNGATIDAIATKENRTRANTIETLVMEALSKREQ